MNSLILETYGHKRLMLLKNVEQPALLIDPEPQEHAKPGLFQKLTQAAGHLAGDRSTCKQQCVESSIILKNLATNCNC